MRYLCNVIIFNNQIYYNSIISTNENQIEILEFESEIHSTIFLSGCLIILNKNKLNQQHLDIISSISKQNDEIVIIADKINEYVILEGLSYNKRTDFFNIDEVGFILCSKNDIQRLNLFNQAD